MSSPNLVYSHPPLRKLGYKFASSGKRAWKICQLRNNSALYCPILLNFGMLVHSESRGYRMDKSHFQSISSWQLCRNWKWLNCYNSALHCPIVLKFGRLVYYSPTELASSLKLRVTGGMSGLKWQCSTNCHRC